MNVIGHHNIRYIENNPVSAGLVGSIELWPWCCHREASLPTARANGPTQSTRTRCTPTWIACAILAAIRGWPNHKQPICASIQRLILKSEGEAEAPILPLNLD
jgi:hypothetical protein